MQKCITGIRRGRSCGTSRQYANCGQLSKGFTLTNYTLPLVLDCLGRASQATAASFLKTIAPCGQCGKTK